MRLALPLLSLASLLVADFGDAVWTPGGVALCTAVGAQSYPDICRSGEGAVVVWQDQRTGPTSTDIYAAKVRPSGSAEYGWPANGVAVCTALGVQESPVLVSDGAGGAVIAWQDNRGGEYDIYAQRVTAAGEIAPGWPADGRLLCSATGDQTAPVICSDGAGGAIVAWSDARAGSANSNIYSQRVTAAGTIAAGWAVNGAKISAAPDLQVFAGIASDGAGGAIVSWVDGRSGTSYDLFAERLTGAGAVAAGWPDSGAVVSKGDGDQTSPDIAADGSGGVYVVWNDHGSFEGNVFAQHLSASGVPVAGWAANGNVVCDEGSAQFAPRVANDGLGGAVFAWEDYRGDGDIYGMRLLANGTAAAGWAADGNSICTATAFQLGPMIVGDGAGGAIVSWEDQRNVGVNNDIYMQHVLANGTTAPGWNSNGEGICTAGDRQYSPRLAVDGAGGAYATWQDRRNAVHYDVYVSRVGPNLTPTVGVGRPVESSALSLAVGPNPFRTSANVMLTLPRGGDVRVDVCDAAGRRIRTLHHGPLTAGAHTFVWDGRDREGAPSPAGVYLVRTSGAGARERALVRLE